MTPNLSHIKIPLASLGEEEYLFIYPENRAGLFEISEEEARENGESIYQLLEGNSYEYVFSNSNLRLDCRISGIISQSNREPAAGRITPNIYVGSLSLFVTDISGTHEECTVEVEVLATKFNTEADKSYRENYRFMLKEITDKCTELLMQLNSPVEQHFETDFTRDNNTKYQRFSFVSSIIKNKDFEEAILKILSSPKTNWSTETSTADLTSVRRITNAATRQIASGSNRFPVKDSHALYKSGITSLPHKINNFRKVEHTDTAENRFIKHALEVFLRFAEDCEHFFKEHKYLRPQTEAAYLVSVLEGYLSHSFFKDISRPTSLKLNSPVLQRQSGYREVLSAWLQYDLAAKLIWKGGNDVYNAGKRDIATLYEYWLFFTLYDLIKEKFRIYRIEYKERSYEHLIVPTPDGMNVMLKQGNHTALHGEFLTESRALKIKFSYNRPFKGGTKYISGKAGSYTTTLRPDYTLSIWPAVLNEEDAEKQDLIVHIHFDAKYKVTQFQIQTYTDPDLLEQEETNERKGIYKNVDLLKMHAYKDAIRRSGGAYVLYPGTKPDCKRGFHEIIPGLGAFAINPTAHESGIAKLSEFIDQVIEHLLDRASQRENISHKSRQIYKNVKDDDSKLHEALPEYLNGSLLIPDDTFVLVGYSKSDEHFQWYNDNARYIFRMDEDRGSIELSNEVVNAKYLLVRRSGQPYASDLFEIKSKGPRVYSRQYLEEIHYPHPANDYYLAIEIKKVTDPEFDHLRWDFKELEAYKKIQQEVANPRTKAGLPFTVSLTQLMRVKIKE